MKIAMSALAVLAVIGGVLQIPGVDDAVTKFLEPTFADSKYVHVEVAHRLGLARPDHRRGDRAWRGIAIAYRIWVGQPGTAARAARAVRARSTSSCRTSGTSTS